MKPIQIISQDLFDKIRSRFTNLEMGDESGTITIDPAEARFFDFDFVIEGVNLGRISVNINDLGSLKIYYSQGITEDKDNLSKKIWYDFLKEMRNFAKRRLLRFDTRDIAKDYLDKKDFQYLANKRPKEEETMTSTMNESRWMLEKSSKKTSRAVKGRTQVIVRHSESMSERRIGERSNPKRIKAIYIENSEGERFKYPFIHPAGAFAMAQHVDHGGIPHDPAGKVIIGMSEKIAQLQEFKRQIQRSTLNDDATGICERAVSRLNELKLKIEALSKRQHYESWMAEFNEQEHNDEILSELDPVQFEEYKSKFTHSSFNEELGKLFPLIHSIMQEKIDLETYVEENQEENQEENNVKEDEFSKFESWAEAIEQGKLTDDQIQDLKAGLDELEATGQKLDLNTAWQFFNQFGIEDSDLEKKLKFAAQELPESDSLDIFKSWANENYPELLVALGLSIDNIQQEPTAAPAPEQPEPQMSSEQPVAEDKQDSMIDEIAKLVKMRYNASNESVGPFNGHEGILLDVEKTISEKFGEKAGEKARLIADSYIKKLTKEWQQRHAEKLMSEKNPQHSHQYDTTMKHADNPTVHQRMAAHDIKPGYRDRIDLLKDLERTGKLKKEDIVAELDQLRARIGTNMVNKHPRPGQTDMRNIPAGNHPDSNRKFTDKDREDQPSRLKAQMKASQGTHSKPNLPEMVDIKKLAGIK